MAAADSRTRNKIVLDSTDASNCLALPRLLVPNVLFILALGLAKGHIVASYADSLWLTVKVLGLASGVIAAGVFVNGQGKRKAIEWPVVGFASLLLSMRLFSLFIALSRMSSSRVMVLTHLSSLWMKSLGEMPKKKSSLFVPGGLLLALIVDTTLFTNNVGNIVPGYIAISLECLSSTALEHARTVLQPALGSFVADGMTIVGAFLISAIVCVCSSPILNPTTIYSSHAYSIAIVPLITYSVLYASPSLARQLSSLPGKHNTLVSYFALIGSTAVLGLFGISKPPSFSDAVVAALLYCGIESQGRFPSGQSSYSSVIYVSRAYLKSIFENPESRKIFYFLVLNLCYMLVQMLYGIWTNSLGLISDAIHMAFDCMAIGVGLIASVMARWAPNERFTYGYGRIETLSGFSNGIFLVLISIFIVFEAIERLIDPPEMNTSQLLLVSTLGLCVNLFGMFAMGGHHHHAGHSHSHGHSHGHSHTSEAKPTNTKHHHTSHAHGHDGMHVATSLHIDTSAASQHAPVDSTAHAPTLDPSGESLDLPHSHSHTSHLLDVSTEPYTHSTSHSHSHSHSQSAATSPSHLPSHSHSHTSDMGLGGKKTNAAKLLLKPHNDDHSPITPNYHFEHDSHYEEYHAHDHGPNLHDHAHIHEMAHEGHSHNMRGVFLHVMADTLGSVGVIISTLLIQLYGWTGFDPIASLFIAILIAASVIPLVIDTGKVLMLDLSHHTTMIRAALASLNDIEGLESCSSARFWPKDDSTLIGSIHIHLSPSLVYIDQGGPDTTLQQYRYGRVDQIVGKVDSILRSSINGLEELTIQVEATH